MTEDDSEIEDDFDEDDHDEENDDHALNALVKLADVIRKIRWFGYLGQPLDIETESLTQSYLGQLGFPDAFPIVVEDWEDAAFAAETTDHNSEAWEVEEQLRADLSQEALLYTDEAVLTASPPLPVGWPWRPRPVPRPCGPCMIRKSLILPPATRSSPAIKPGSCWPPRRWKTTPLR